MTAVTIPAELADEIRRDLAAGGETAARWLFGPKWPGEGAEYVTAEVDDTGGHVQLLVGSVDGGPRPGVGDRVLVLAWEQRTLEGQRRPPSIEHVIALCDEPGPFKGEITTTWAVDDDPQGGYCATRWAILPPAPDAEPQIAEPERRPGTNTGHGHVWPRPDGDPEPTDAVEGPPARPEPDVADTPGLNVITGHHPPLAEPAMFTIHNPTPNRWRLGRSWGTAGGPLVTIVEEGTEPPDEDGRRPDDRLVGSLLAEDAALVVDSVNHADRYRARLDMPCGECHPCDAPSLREQLAAAERTLTELAPLSTAAERDLYRTALERIAHAYPAAGNSAGGSAGDVAREALGPAREEIP